MANENAGWTRREQVTLDGVTYEIIIRQANGGFFGAWECAACNAGGESGLQSSSAEQASERAQVSLYAHHILAHRSTDAGEARGSV
jgi:hypothetical protein